MMGGIRKKYVTLLVFMISCLFTLDAFSEGEIMTPNSSEPGEKTPEKKEPTREEILLRVNKMLKKRPSLRDEVPGVRLIGDPETGYIEYNGTPVDSLDIKSLKRLLAVTVNTSQKQQIENVDRLHRQLMNVQSVSRLNQSIPSSVPVSPPPQPPRPVNIPTPPPTPPRIPPPPPRTR